MKWFWRKVKRDFRESFEDSEEQRRLRFIAWAQSFRNEMDGEVILATGEVVTPNQLDVEADRRFWDGRKR